MTKRGRKVGTEMKENVFGNVEGYDVGYTFQTREELSDCGIHRPKVASLHVGNGGVYSILISSRYRGEDNGCAITYVGPCVRGNGYNGAYNESLIKNYTSHIPIRVIRGQHKESPFAPLSGYRYDGLYLIDKYWRLNNKIVYHFMRMNQIAPPWFKRVPRGAESPTSDSFESDDDISGYVAFIRCQDRPVSNLKTAKEECINEEEEEEGSSHDSPENILEYPPEDVPLVNENVSEVQSVPLTNEEPSIRADHQTLETPLSVTRSSNPPDVLPIQPHCNEELLNPDLTTEPPSENVGQTKTLIGGMPMPFMKFEACKEEYSAGYIVYEGVTTVPGHEVLEVYNESVIYEEQETEVTELVDSEEEEEEEDYQVVEEQEVDCSYFSRDFSNREIVTATELVETININSENLPEGVYDVDVEDGPKYGQTRRYLEATQWQNDQLIEDPTVQNSSSLAIIKSDETTVIPTGQFTARELEIVECDNNMISEQNLNSLHEIKHDLDNDNIEELPMQPSLEAETSSSELQIGNIVGSCVYVDANNDSENIAEPIESTLNENLNINFTLHDLQMCELTDEDSSNSKSINDEETMADITDSTTDNPTPSLGDLPDSTSNLMIKNAKPPCDCDNDDCPLRTFNLFDTIGFLLKDYRSSSICKTLKKLSCWNFYKQIFKGKHKGKTMLKLNEKNRNAILPGPSGNNNTEEGSEEGIGFISNVQFGEDGMNAWNNLGRSDEGNNDENNDQEESNNGNIQSNNNHELVTYNESGDENLNHNARSKFKALRLKAVEELCHVLLDQIQQIKASKEYGDPLADTEDKALRDDLEKKVLKKFSRLPCFVNEKKEVILQHKKRKRNNLTVDDERSANQEVNQPSAKVRMVQYRRNIRTEINRTRILKINQTCAPISEDREDSNSSGEFSDEGMNITRESQVRDNYFTPDNRSESTIRQSDQEKSDIQSDISEENLVIDANSDENVHDEDVLTTNVSQSQNISKTGQTNLRLRTFSIEDEIEDSNTDTENSELSSNLTSSSQSTFEGTFEEPYETVFSSPMANHESSTKRKLGSELLKETIPTKRSNYESLPSTSTEYRAGDNLDPIEKFKGFTSKEINKTIKFKALSNRLFLSIEREIFNFNVPSTSTNVLNINDKSPTVPARPKSTRRKQKIQRINL